MWSIRESAKQTSEGFDYLIAAAAMIDGFGAVISLSFFVYWDLFNSMWLVDLHQGLNMIFWVNMIVALANATSLIMYVVFMSKNSLQSDEMICIIWDW